MNQNFFRRRQNVPVQPDAAETAPQNGKDKPKKGRLVDNKLFLMGMSVLAAFSFWVGISFSDTTTEVTRRIKNVPIVYENLPANVTELGLEVIDSSITVEEVDVTIYGKQYIVNQIDAKDLVATVKYRDVTGAGYYLGEVQVVNVNRYWDFQITGVDIDTVGVQLDRIIDQTFTLEYETNPYTAADGYTLRVPKLSDTTVRISGTTQDIAKIRRVVARAEVPSVINGTLTRTADIVLLDMEGNELTNLNVETGIKETELTIVAMVVKQVPIRIQYLHAPSNLGNMVSLSQSSVELALPTDLSDSIPELVVGTIDFAEVHPDSNVFEFSIDEVLPNGVVRQSNLSTVTAMVRMDNIAVRQFEVTDIWMKNTTGVNAALLTKSVSITVVGHRSQLDNMTAESISLTADVSNYQNFGKIEINAEATLVDGSRCWVYGEPTVLVEIRETA